MFEDVIKTILGIPLAACVLVVIIVFVAYLIVFLQKKKETKKATPAPDTEAPNLSIVDSMSGIQFERFVAELLCKDGFTDVRTTPPSGDFGVDVLAEKDGLLWAFQCKNYKSKLGVKPIQEVFAGTKKYGADMSVVITNSRFTEHAEVLAISLDVELWDRDTLSDLINHTQHVVTRLTKNCPKCGQNQRADRNCCFRCGAPF